MKKFLFALVCITLVYSFSFGETMIEGGDVSGSWSAAGSPYLIDGDILIPDGQELNIEPGVLVEFQGHYKLDIQGTLNAVGTEQDTIVFTINDTTGFGDTLITDGGWHGMRFENTSEENDSSFIIYCKLEYGKAIGGTHHDRIGGAIRLREFSKLRIENSVIENNLAYEEGAGIHLYEASPKIYNTIIRNNVCRGERSDAGGILLYFASPHIKNCIIENNHTAFMGGGMSFLYDCYAVMEYCEIIGNSAPLGGGVFADLGSPIIKNCVFRDNQSTYGGGLFLFYHSSPFLKNNLVTNNYARFGGGINCRNGSSPEMINNLICNNSAIDNGGGLVFWNSDPYILNNTICYNDAPLGGGMMVSWTSYPEFKNSIVWGNTASNGAQVHLLNDSCNPKFDFCSVEGGYENFGGEGAGVNYNYYEYYTNSTEEDPLFVLPAIGSGSQHDGLAADYSLLEGSGCIDRGDPYIAGMEMPFYDILGNIRIYNYIVDLGPYEWQGNSVVEPQLASSPVKTNCTLSNYPNPFNPSTSITYSIPGNLTGYSLAIYNSKGRKVIAFSLKGTNGQARELVWDGKNYAGKLTASGVYFCRLDGPGILPVVERMLLLK